MIENGNKKYYTPIEILQMIRDNKTEMNKIWEKYFPSYNSVILLDQITRTLNNARKARKINYMAFKKNETANKFFYAYAIEDIENYLKSEYL